MPLLFLTGGWWHLQKGLIGLWFLLKALSVQKRFFSFKNQGSSRTRTPSCLVAGTWVAPSSGQKFFGGPTFLKNLNFLVLKPKSHFLAETWLCFEFQISESGLLKKKKLEFQFSTR
ncbi:Hypothetical predicted protein [Podarcis lilfordi]|uniref:Uncharacterized protein n=1 Tax=Podarcis lilfordi TaxID=74358 RepID=A0AA35L2B9_9SAUR|nr:Hypothetical predicted protein [Podarcis lilfordi]